ncbi:hypothetical protein AOQ72_04935 [Bradyrhizobium yuanmingense]|uniref:Uncharacterized protein n=1 Tax=Bradyrhizobium yuanmingense TaxID=108015 RepID=A0A0R3BIK0_9BRAD|nr:hypothetical protein AOQ72_04935 [Bradyrhizobium yuanmingense]
MPKPIAYRATGDDMRINNPNVGFIELLLANPFGLTNKDPVCQIGDDLCDIRIGLFVGRSIARQRHGDHAGARSYGIESSIDTAWHAR